MLTLLAAISLLCLLDVTVVWACCKVGDVSTPTPYVHPSWYEDSIIWGCGCPADARGGSPCDDASECPNRFIVDIDDRR